MSAAGFVRRPAVRDQRVDDRRQLPRPGVADDRAVEAAPGCVQSMCGAASGSVLVPADEGERVAAARIGERDAGVGRDRDRRRHAGHDLERDALLVQEQRLLAAAVEDERIAPLQAGDDLALARLLGEQVADRVLVDRLRRGGADVDALGIGACLAQQPRVHEVVVDDDIRGLQASEPARGDQVRCTGPGANEVDEGAEHTRARVADGAERGRCHLVRGAHRGRVTRRDRGRISTIAACRPPRSRSSP